MKLSLLLVRVLAELGIGTALFVCLQQSGEIRRSFFGFQSWLIAFAFFLASITDVGGRFVVSPWFPAAIFAALAAILFRMERPHLGKMFLVISAILGAAFLGGEIWLNADPGARRIFSIANHAAGALLFGWVHGSMVLGHWYLIMRGLSFGHFQRATFQLLIAVVVRGVGALGIGCWLAYDSGSTHPATDLLYLSMRVLWGLLLPGAFGFMAWRCALTGSNQAGTGLLYIAEVAVLIGEILALRLGF